MANGGLLSKEQFVSIIDGIVAAHDVSDQISGIIRESVKRTGNDMVVDFFDPFVLYSGQLNALVKTLEVMFCDENEWISWWLFECNYGHDKGLLTTAYGSDGKNIPMQTSGDLYDQLVADMEKSNK